MSRKLIIVILVLSVLYTPNIYAENVIIKVVTEDAYPLQYSFAGNIEGPATDLVRAVLKEAGLKYDIAIFPWARSYEQALTQENTLIYSLARTLEREKSFKWIGSIIKLEYHMVGLNDLELPNLVELHKLKKLKIGAIRSSVTHKYLLANGFTNIYLLSKTAQSIKLLKSGRIDLFPINYSSFQLYCLKSRMDCQQLSSKFKLENLSNSLYMAFSNATSDETVEKVRAAYQKVMH